MAELLPHYKEFEANRHRTLDEVRVDIDQVDFEMGPWLANFLQPDNAAVYDLACQKLEQLCARRMILALEVGMIKSVDKTATVQPGRYRQVCDNYEYNRQVFAPSVHKEVYELICELLHSASVGAQERQREVIGSGRPLVNAA